MSDPYDEILFKRFGLKKALKALEKIVASAITDFMSVFEEICGYPAPPKVIVAYLKETLYYHKAFMSLHSKSSELTIFVMDLAATKLYTIGILELQQKGLVVPI